MVLGQLAGQGLNPAEWGGDIEVIRTSATTGQGIQELIEISIYQSQLLELKADPNAPRARHGHRIAVDPGLGPVATVLVQDGTLKLGDVILCRPGLWPHPQLLNDLGKPIKQAGPEHAGDRQRPERASRRPAIILRRRRCRSRRAIAEERARIPARMQLAGQNRVTARQPHRHDQGRRIQTINLIIKADVQGSVERSPRVSPIRTPTKCKRQGHSLRRRRDQRSDVQLAMATKTKPTTIAWRSSAST